MGFFCQIMTVYNLPACIFLELSLPTVLNRMNIGSDLEEIEVKRVGESKNYFLVCCQVVDTL